MQKSHAIFAAMHEHNPFSTGTHRVLFKHISEALHSTGGFAPKVAWSLDASGSLKKPERLWGDCHLIPYPRENLQKYAARSACATYESHLRDACERFTAYLGRKAPQRAGIGPLHQLLIDDADDAGSHLDVFWQNFMLEALARGSMLMLVDMPEVRFDANMAQTLQDQSRSVPYLTAIKPEDVADYRMGRRGRFEYVNIEAHEYINNRLEPVIRYFDAQGWRVIKGHDPQGQQVLRSGVHSFGQCPVLIYTENSAPYPCIGRFAQIAPLSNRMFNARSELVEIMRSQTFSLLTQQIASEADRDAAQRGVTTIGTSAMLFHTGSTPAFIAPDSGPAQTYLAEIEELRATIARIGMETQAEPGTAPESGLSRKLRFEGLNAALSRFARAMQDLEARMWALFGRALGITQTVEVTWPGDYNLIDTIAELDVLLVMQQTGFPPEVLQAKRAAIVAAEFDRAEPAVLQALQDALTNPAQEVGPGDAGDAGDAGDGAAPAALDLTPVLDEIKSLAVQVAAIPANNPPSAAPEKLDLSPITAQIASLGAQVAALAAQPVQPAPIVMLDPAGNVTKQIQITRDAAGNITGASVAPQPTEPPASKP